MSLFYPSESLQRKLHNTLRKLSKKVLVANTLPNEVRLVAGLDVAYRGDVGFGALAVYDVRKRAFVEVLVEPTIVRIPYIPSLLSFREAPPMLKVLSKAQVAADVYLVNGLGALHPDGCGLASYIGVVTNVPTIGVTKGLLRGNYTFSRRGGYEFIANERGVVLGARIRLNKRSLYVTVGHMVSAERAVEVVHPLLGKSYLPIPLLKAHEEATKAARGSSWVRQSRL